MIGLHDMCGHLCRNCGAFVGAPESVNNNITQEEIENDWSMHYSYDDDLIK